MSEQTKLNDIANQETGVNFRSPSVLTRAEQLPSGWDVADANSITKIKTGHTPSTDTDEYWNGNIPWIAIHDLSGLDTVEIDETEDNITEEGLANSGAKLIPEGALALCRTGSIGESAILNREMATDQSTVTFECYPDLSNPYFLMYIFQWCQPELERLGIGSTHPSIQLDFFPDLQFLTPPIEEQRKIATILHTVDQAIQKTEEIIEQEERVLNGILNEVFIRGIDESGNIRPSPGDSPDSYEEAERYFIPNEWDVDSLQNLCTENITYGIVQPGPHIEDGVSYINTEDMTDGSIPTGGLSKTSQEIAEKYCRSEIHTGELVVTIRATVGAVDQVPPELDGANLTRGTARVVPGDTINNRFLLWAIRSNAIQSELEARVKGTTFDEINLDQLGKIPIPYPIDMDEQSRIVEMLSTIDSQLENEDTYLESLRRIKRGLMQDLLSGEVRAAGTNIGIPEEVAKYG